jgi:hypothetical protein
LRIERGEAQREREEEEAVSRSASGVRIRCE